MPGHSQVEEISSAAILAAKRLVCVTPKVNLRECVTHMPPPSANKAANSGFESQGRHHQKSKTGVSLPLNLRGDIPKSPKQGYQWHWRI